MYHQLVQIATMQKSNIKPSKYQSSIYDFITNGEGNAVVEAVAGSGKTTTIIGALSIIRKGDSTAFFAFNKAISDDISRRLSILQRAYVNVSTIHSYGYSTIRNNVSGKVNLDSRKYNDIFIELFGKKKISMSPDEFKDMYENVMSLVDFMRLFLCNTRQDIKAVTDKYGMVVSDNEVQAAMDVLGSGRKILNTIDFTDMIYLPVYHKMNCMRYRWVFIDECQDLSRCQRLLAMMSISGNGRFIAVGDSRQSIYAFSGADMDSFNELVSVQNTIRLPLSVCYRCGSDIVDLARGIVPQIESREGASSGEVVQSFNIQDIAAGDMVLCRNTKPLVSLCTHFMKLGISATIVGQDIGSSLIKLIDESDRSSINSLVSDLSIMKNKKLKSIIKKLNCSIEEATESDDYDRFSTKCDCVIAASDGCNDVSELKNKIKSMFEEKGSSIILSTIHKSKGLEADRVMILMPELMPSKRAKSDSEILQEMNLIYVAYTRAKNFLAMDIDWRPSDRQSTPNREKSAIRSSGDYVGSVGCDSTSNVVLKEIKEVTTKFGSANKFIFSDEFGNVLCKFGNLPSKVSIGDRLNLRFTVGRHSEFNGCRETVISTVKSISPR